MNSNQRNQALKILRFASKSHRDLEEKVSQIEADNVTESIPWEQIVRLDDKVVEHLMWISGSINRLVEEIIKSDYPERVDGNGK